MCDQCEQTPPQTGAATPRGRLKLWQIKPHYHCAILGTCLTMDELRKVVRQSGLTLKESVSDYDLHATLVGQAEQNNRAAKNLQRMLDTKYRRWIQTLAKCKEDKAIRGLWQMALLDGDIAGPFWAIMTHPQAGLELVAQAYEDVHMLSHIQGASNRADLKYLKRLQTELSELKQTLHRTRQQHQRQLRQRDSLIESQANKPAMPIGAAVAEAMARDDDQVADLQRHVQSLNRRLDWTEGQLAQREIEIAHLREERLGLKELLAESKAEHQALEQTLNRLLAQTLSQDQSAQQDIDLKGKRILYVGGQVSLAPHLRSLVEAHNGRFRHHDGGLEESRAGLQCALTGADIVFCPVDCISHDACQRAKQYCRQQNKQFIPLRSSGLSAFAAGLHRHANPSSPQ